MEICNDCTKAFKTCNPDEDTCQGFDSKLNKYEIWIRKYYPTPDSARLQCEIATQLMVQEFPELKRIRGLVSVEEPYGLQPTKTPHWWCVNVYGFVVDPTSHQYPTKILEYHPCDESKGEPTGKCPNCGELCYKGNYFCSDNCETEFRNSLGV